MTQIPARIYVMTGQLAWLGSSVGMTNLAKRIQRLWPNSAVSVHDWKYGPNQIATDILKQPAGLPIILIGYSLGGNGLTRIAATLPKRQIDLAVAYDPSQLGERYLNAEGQAPTNIKRLLLYHNNSPEPWGHWIIPGKQVEITETYTSHLLVCYNEVLHQKTLAAIAKLLGPPAQA